jgi:hypothetical protein
MATPDNNPVPAASAAAPATSAPAPASGASPSPSPAPASMPAAKPTAPKAPEKGSPEAAAKLLSEAARKDAEGPEPAAAPAATTDPKATPAASAKDPANPDPAPASAVAEPGNDLLSHVDALSKDGKALTYTHGGKTHEIKNRAQLENLLARAHDHGRLGRELSDIKKQHAENYAPFDKAIETRPGFENVVTSTFNQPELDGILDAILEGKASPELADAIQKGVPLKNPDRIKANILSRQVEGRTEQEKAQQTERETLQDINTGLQTIADKLGYRISKENPDDLDVYRQVRDIQAKKPGLSFFEAFKLTDKYDSLLTAAQEKKAADAAEQARIERTTKQNAIAAAAGVPGSGAKPQSITAEKGSPDDAKARLRAANAQRSV